MCGTGRIIWAKFKSFLSHIVNKHENLDDPLFNKCGHGNNISHRKWFLPGKHSGFGRSPGCGSRVILLQLVIVFRLEMHGSRGKQGFIFYISK